MRVPGYERARGIRQAVFWSRRLSYAHTLTLLAVLAAVLAASSRSSPGAETAAERGFRLLTEKPYLTPDFDQEVFDRLYTVWPLELRKQGEKASPAERRRIAFERYGLTEFPDSPRRTALQYVAAPDGGWAMNCLACHTGKVAGRVIFGAPNTLYDLQTLTEEVRAVKQMLGKRMAHMDGAALVYPLGTTRGTTNAVMFGQILLAYRDPRLNFHPEATLPIFRHHDVDAIPWWHYKRKTHLYCDGFAPKSARALMQFLMIPKNGPQQFAEWERDYVAIEAWIASLEAPKYPFAVDQELAASGRPVFERHCARCHGTYERNANDKINVDWPEKIVPIAEVDTDPVRLEALTVEGRERYGRSWFCDYGRSTIIADPRGYVAPPLDGIWASAPYLHNGSVPTLWHLFHSDARPKIWHRTEDGYDQGRVGLEITIFDELPPDAKDDARERRRYFDTQQSGKSPRGHTFPDALSENEKQAVIEYLKTL
jgi:mono/diheme cytochrome c family protein